MRNGEFMFNKSFENDESRPSYGDPQGVCDRAASRFTFGIHKNLRAKERSLEG
jgi:hypothetical protein